MPTPPTAASTVRSTLPWPRKTSGSSDGGGSDGDGEGEEDVLDEALDALLDAEVEGSGEAYANRFTDDFDVLAAQADASIVETRSRETKSEPAARAAGGSGDPKRRRKR